MKTFTMIARHGDSKDNITAYTLISSDYQLQTVTVKELVKAISEKKIAVTNLAVTAKGIESTNGALDRYTLIDNKTNAVVGTARAVILDRVEKEGKLVGYTMFTQNGTLAEVNVKDAVALVNDKLISNGKIRHTEQGDIVSSVGGTYPLRQIEIAKAPKGETSAELLYFGTTVGTNAEYFGAIVSCTSASEMSKIRETLTKSNSALIKSVASVGGDKVKKSLSIQRMGANSLYGVFSIEVLDKLIKSKAVIGNKLSKIPVSAVKYEADGVDESTVELNGEWKILGTNEGEADTTRRVKEYTKKIIETYEKVNLKK